MLYFPDKFSTDKLKETSRDVSILCVGIGVERYRIVFNKQAFSFKRPLFLWVILWQIRLFVVKW